MTNKEAKCRPNVIICTLSIFHHNAFVLIDSGPERSFVSTISAYHANRALSPLSCELVGQTPLSDEIVRSLVFLGCPILVGGVIL